jgi:hypothetical protein
MAIPGPAGDVVALASACGSGRSIVLNGEESAEGASDALRAFEMANGRRVPVIPPVILPGSLVALWPSNGNEALAIVRRHGLDRYEAFLVGLSCAR